MALLRSQDCGPRSERRVCDPGASVGKPALCSINARTNIDRLTRRSVGIGVGAVSNELIHAAARILATRDDFERVIRQWLLQCEADELTGEETLAEVTYHARAQEQNNRLRPRA
jgi:hypothetical protein